VHHSITLVHILLQISLHILKNESQGAMRVDDVMQCDNVRVFEVLEKGYFSDGSAGCSLLMLQSDLLQGY